MDFLGRRAGGPRTRLLSAAAAAIVIAVLAILAALIGGADPDDPVRRRFEAASAPILKIAAWPVRRLREAGEGLNDHWAAVERVRALEAEVAALERWRGEALRLRRLNARYEDLIGLKAPPEIGRVGGRIIGEAGGPFVRTILMDVGAADGLRQGHAVVDGRGLVGRVVNVSESAARVLLLTDLNSRVPVEVVETGARAILAGDNTARPRLLYARPDEDLKIGDLLVTSGDGRLFPAGVPVGRVVAGDEDGRDEDAPRVDLFGAAERTDHAVALLYAFPALAEGEG